MPNPLTSRGVPAANAVTADNNIDNDNNALQPGGPGTAIRSPKFTLTVQGEPSTDGDDINGDLTLDFGLRATVCVGNLVFKDIDNNGIYNSAIDQTVGRRAVEALRPRR